MIKELKELIKVANSLDAKGFLKEADALDKIIRRAMEEGERTEPGLPDVDSDKKELEGQLQETADWFGTLILATGGRPKWPVIAGKDYIYRGAWEGEEPGDKKFIEKGTIYESFHAAPEESLSLADIYEELKGFVEENNLNVRLPGVFGLIDNSNL